jgi:arabinan endo-1,5-alpha-L-arabinosidase
VTAVGGGGRGALGGRRSPAELRSPPGAPDEYAVGVRQAHGRRRSAYALTITGDVPTTGERRTKRYRLARQDQRLILNLLARIGRDFGTCIPRNRRPLPRPTFHAVYDALLTEAVDARILYGYGDPAVLRVDGAVPGETGPRYYAVVTSNDAPDAFPILRSADLRRWESVGFAFPEGHTPPWAANGENVADYWAPELHQVGGTFLLVFVARHRETHELCVGVATSARPDGPFVAADEPLLRRGAIDPHVLVDADGAAYLYWKDDRNDVWRNALNELLYECPQYIRRLFPTDEGRRTASLVATCWPWTRELEPMERFLQQVLIETVTSDFSAFEGRLRALVAETRGAAARRRIRAVLDALKTPIYAQPLDAPSLRLVGSPRQVLTNDRPWEAHVIEGMWVLAHAGRYYMFYAGNDFSTAEYGIGVAVATSPLGPFRKFPEPFLRTTVRWSAPGHPSVTVGPDGEYVLLFHAFFPGDVGYKRFRALLATAIAFEDGAPVLRPAGTRTPRQHAGR